MLGTVDLDSIFKLYQQSIFGFTPINGNEGKIVKYRGFMKFISRPKTVAECQFLSPTPPHQQNKKKTTRGGCP